MRGVPGRAPRRPRPRRARRSAAVSGRGPVDRARRAPPGRRTAGRSRPGARARPAASAARAPRPTASAAASGPCLSVGRPPVSGAPSSSTTTSSTPAPHSWRSVPAGSRPVRTRVCAAPTLGCPAKGSSADGREDPHPVVGAGLGGRAEERGLRAGGTRRPAPGTARWSGRRRRTRRPAGCRRRPAARRRRRPRSRAVVPGPPRRRR